MSRSNGNILTIKYSGERQTIKGFSHHDHIFTQNCCYKLSGKNKDKQHKLVVTAVVKYKT